VHGRVEIRSTIQAQIEDLVANAKAAPENSETDDKLTNAKAQATTAGSLPALARVAQ
jgi:hypothetical protein